jgi:hypothetical protein
MYTLLVDFGLVVLIWMVQLIVYPGLGYYSQSDLKIWHVKYMPSITRIVMPLMLAQIVLHFLNLYQNFSWTESLAISLIGLAWINTFFFAAPTHFKISKEEDIKQSVEDLVHINWYRTVLWSIVFLLSLYHWLKN